VRGGGEKEGSRGGTDLRLHILKKKYMCAKGYIRPTKKKSSVVRAFPRSVG